MKIRYVGPHQSVEIAATGQQCPKGEPVEVKADLGRSLLKSPFWEKVQDPPHDPRRPEKRDGTLAKPEADKAS